MYFLVIVNRMTSQCFELLRETFLYISKNNLSHHFPTNLWSQIVDVMTLPAGMQWVSGTALSEAELAAFLNPTTNINSEIVPNGMNLMGEKKDGNQSESCGSTNWFQNDDPEFAKDAQIT